MSAADGSPTVEVYENRQPDAEMTKTHEFEVHGPRDPDAIEMTYAEQQDQLTEWKGAVTVEYKPGQYALEEGALQEFIDDLSDDVEQPEDLVFDVYKAIVDAVYPAHAGYDDPWNKVPLVVTLEYQRDGEKSTATLGQYR